jgi:hypothetical protein
MCRLCEGYFWLRRINPTSRPTVPMPVIETHKCVVIYWCLIRFPRFDIYGGPPFVSAWVIHVWIGWLIAVVDISVIVRRILLVRRHCGERAVSCSNAMIAVMRKHPVMALMILPCNDGSRTYALLHMSCPNPDHPYISQEDPFWTISMCRPF